MTTTTQPAWLDALSDVIEHLRRLDLKIHTDTHLEPAPSTSKDQVHTSVWSKTRMTSHGRLVAELEYAGCLRFWHLGSDRGPEAANQATAAPDGLDAGQAAAK